jgi:hypothetical protein
MGHPCSISTGWINFLFKSIFHFWTLYTLQLLKLGKKIDIHSDHGSLDGCKLYISSSSVEVLLSRPPTGHIHWPLKNCHIKVILDLVGGTNFVWAITVGTIHSYYGSLDGCELYISIWDQSLAISNPPTGYIHWSLYSYHIRVILCLVNDTVVVWAKSIGN